MSEPVSMDTEIPLANPTSYAVPARPITKGVCEAVFQAVHKDMRELLDFHTIYPLLNARHLLRPGLDQAILTNPTITNERRIDVLISWLPKCELSDYLTPFVESLMESSDQAGDAHKELASMMKLQLSRLQSAPEEQMSCPADGARDNCVERDGPTTHAHRHIQDNQTNQSYEVDEKSSLLPTAHIKTGFRRFSLIKCLILLLVLIFFIACTVFTLLFTAVLPSKELVLTSGTTVFGNSTLTLASNPNLLEAITLQFSDPKPPQTPTVIIAKDMECSQLPVQIIPRPDKPGSDYVFALPGSQISFPVPKNDSSAVNETWPHIWVTDSYEIFQDFNNKVTPQIEGACQQFYKCENFPFCFASEDYVGGHIVYNVTRQGYYNYFFSNRSGDCNRLARSDTNTVIRWHYNAIQYDIRAIYQNQSKYTFLAMDKDINSLHLSGTFEFGRKSCVLLDIRGEEGNPSTVKISVKVPWDAAVLVFIVCVLLLICAIHILMGSYFCWKYSKLKLGREIKHDIV